MKKMKKNKKFYAVAIGERRGIYNTWKECQKHIGKGYSRHKSFKTKKEAEDFIMECINSQLRDNTRLKKNENQEQLELQKVKNIKVVFVPKSNMDKNLLAEKAKKSFELNKAKLEERERIKQRDLEILRSRSLIKNQKI